MVVCGVSTSQAFPLRYWSWADSSCPFPPKRAWWNSTSTNDMPKKRPSIMPCVNIGLRSQVPNPKNTFYCLTHQRTYFMFGHN